MTDMSNAQQMPMPDVRGWLAINGLPPEYQRAEDGTADADRTRARQRQPRGHERPATTTEVTLLQWLGYTMPTEQLVTRVSWPSRSVRRRTWPQLETEES